MIEQWSLERSGPPRAMGHWSVPGFVSSMAVSPNGRTVALALGDRLVLHDLERGAGCEQRVPNALLIRALAFAPDGQSLASGGGGDNAIRIWGLSDEQLVLRDTLGLGAENWIRGLAYAADGCTLVSFDTEGRLRTWDRAGRLLEESLTGISLCRLAALQPDARLVLSVSDAEHLARLRHLPHTAGRDPSRSP
jgi:WD40 repeat protein